MMVLKKAGMSGLSRWFGAATLASFLAACGGGSGAGDVPTAPADAFAVTNLVSDDPALHPTHLDPDLVNAWGLVFNPRGFSWVANNGSSRSTLYDGTGAKQPLVVAVAETPARPTGIVFNGSSEFKIMKAGVAQPAPFIFASEAGKISAWAPDIDFDASVTVYDGGAQGKVYKGLALASVGGIALLYATDFRNGRVDAFNTSYELVDPPGNFVDPLLPAGFSPFGILSAGNRIYVSYARRAAGGDDEQDGAGLGAIAVFDAAGNFIRELAFGGALNAPWGMAIAPQGFGTLGGRLLVANFGDGAIHAFDTGTGAMAGTLSDRNGTPLAIDGLWGIAFGNGLFDQPGNTLFFTAGPDDESHGLFGRIDGQPR